MMDAEKDIITRLKEGDENAMMLVFSLYHKALYYFVKQIVNNDEQTEDIVADAFIKLWENNSDFDELATIKCFLYKTVRVRCLDHLQYPLEKDQAIKKISGMVGDEENYLNSKMIKAELLQTLAQEIEDLSPIRQKIFKMIFFEGLSIFEVAERLQVTIDTVRVQ